MGRRRKIQYVKKCPICGKTFDTYGYLSWPWRTNNVYFCTYKCARVDDKKHEKRDIGWSEDELAY